MYPPWEGLKHGSKSIQTSQILRRRLKMFHISLMYFKNDKNRYFRTTFLRNGSYLLFYHCKVVPLNERKIVKLLQNVRFDFSPLATRTIFARDQVMQSAYYLRLVYNLRLGLSARHYRGANRAYILIPEVWPIRENKS